MEKITSEKNMLSFPDIHCNFTNMVVPCQHMRYIHFVFPFNNFLKNNLISSLRAM